MSLEQAADRRAQPSAFGTSEIGRSWDAMRLAVGSTCSAPIIALGVDAPPAPAPHWADRTGTTLIVSLDPGSRGTITVHGHPVSTEAATRLAANGFVQILRNTVDRTSNETTDETSESGRGGEPEPDEQA